MALLINLWQIYLQKHFYTLLIQTGFWPLHVYNPLLVEIILAFDTFYLFVSWLSYVIAFLRTAGLYIVRDDLSPDDSDIPQEKVEATIKVIITLLRVVYVITALSFVQLALNEPLLKTVSFITLSTSFMSFILLKLALLEWQGNF
jgi:hypothetical protein